MAVVANRRHKKPDKTVVVARGTGRRRAYPPLVRLTPVITRANAAVNLCAVPSAVLASAPMRLNPLFCGGVYHSTSLPVARTLRLAAAVTAVVSESAVALAILRRTFAFARRTARTPSPCRRSHYVRTNAGSTPCFPSDF